MSLKYKSHGKHPPNIRSSSSNSTGGGGGGGGQELHTRKEKRLQVTDPEPIQIPRSDAPKTSEFAYFKKFKKEHSGGSSRSLNRSDNFKTSHVNELDFESSISAERFADLRQNIRTSFQAEIQEPEDRSPFPSPSPIDVDNNYCVENRKGKPHEIKHVSFCLSGNTSKGSQDVFASPFGGTSTKDSGNLSAEDGIFSTKRKKLRQCVVESFKDVEGLNVNSTGFDLISILLNRLFPPEDESKCHWHSKSQERVNGADDHPSFPEPDNLDKSSTLFASTSQSDSVWSDVLPPHSSGRPWNMIASGFCETKYDVKSNLLDYEGDRFHGFDHENTVKFLCADNDSIFTKSYKKLHSTGLCLRELDDFHDPEEASGNKPCNLFLSLDEEDNKESSHTTMDEAFRAQLELCSGRDFHLKDAYIHEHWKIYKDDYATEVEEHYLQHLPSPPRYLTWEEEEEEEEEEDLNACDDFSYRQTDPSCVFDTTHFSRGLNTTYLGLECLPVIDLFSNYSSANRIFTLPWKEDCIPFDSDNKETSLNYLEKCLPPPDDDFDSLDRSPAYFDSIIGEVMGKPLLLDYPYKVSYED